MLALVAFKGIRTGAGWFFRNGDSVDIARCPLEVIEMVKEVILQLRLGYYTYNHVDLFLGGFVSARPSATNDKHPDKKHQIRNVDSHTSIKMNQSLPLCGCTGQLLQECLWWLAAKHPRPALWRFLRWSSFRSGLRRRSINFRRVTCKINNFYGLGRGNGLCSSSLR